MRRIDDFIIDRIFQPIADALARWASCYAIAAFLLTGFALAETIFNVLLEKWFLLTLFATWMPMLLIECYALQKKGLCEVMPANRIMRTIPRLVFLSLAVLQIPMTIFVYAKMSFYLLYVHDDWLLITGLYFMACHMIPPRRRRQAAPHWAAVSEGA